MRYYQMSKSLIDKYGVKTYKLPLHLEGTCPNRDGTIAKGGCSFCAEGAMDFELLDAKLPIAVQLEKNMAYIGKRYGAKAFIAYFQNYSATYRPIEELLWMMKQCLIDGIVEISLSTRPDCIPTPMLRELKKFSDRYAVEVTLELGVQCLNDEVLKNMGRGHDARTSLDAMKRIKGAGLNLGVHCILNYPAMERGDVIDLAKACSEIGANRVKLHSLYIEKGTRLGDDYLKEKFELCGYEEYLERVLLFLGYLKKDIALERFFARAPQETTLFCNWSRSWRYLMEELEILMDNRDFEQGQCRRNHV